MQMVLMPAKLIKKMFSAKFSHNVRQWAASLVMKALKWQNSTF
jgi:hypothetical protein